MANFLMANFSRYFVALRKQCFCVVPYQYMHKSIYVSAQVQNPCVLDNCVIATFDRSICPQTIGSNSFSIPKLLSLTIKNILFDLYCRLPEDSTASFWIHIQQVASIQACWRLCIVPMNEMRDV